jgi:hypothetical protein
MIVLELAPADPGFSHWDSLKGKCTPLVESVKADQSQFSAMQLYNMSCIERDKDVQ